MARIKFVDTYPADGPLLGARKLAKSLGKLTPARHGVKVEDDESEPEDSKNPDPNSSDAEDDSEEDTNPDAGPYADRIRGRNLVPRPDRPRMLVPELPRQLRHRDRDTATGAAPSTSTQNTNATSSPDSSQSATNASLNGNRDLFPGRILKTIKYAHETRKLMRGTPWTEEADLSILYLRRKGVTFRRIANQFIVHVTGHTRTACQQRWQRLKTLNADLSREEKVKFEEEMSRVEREQFPNGIPAAPAEPPAPPPAQDGTSGASQDQNAGDSGSAATTFAPVDLTQDDDSDSTLTEPGSSSPPDPFDGPSSSQD
ncbi:hypothetical protein QBC37DRAFT_378061 [Rhypophila decipiens]|uniref:Myb-like domain-containing protein n=1 Tax=Rhypophila decipiens TaxID=261697 RepID=A0AAN7B1N7_9PEZI|nr:hypothetical protein QBC37DRAFT_378061 [Rhypophila decipiens]